MKERDSEILIEGFRPDELPDALQGEALAAVLNGRPMVVNVGSATILASVAITDRRCRAELAHVDGGGEGVLRAVFLAIQNLARRNGAEEIEWRVFAVNCARPNPKLRAVLERIGFVIRHIPGSGDCFCRSDRI